MNKLTKFVFAAMLVLLASCTPSIGELGEWVFAGNNERCLPPCWYDMVPGETNYAEAKKVFSGLEFLDMKSISDQENFDNRQNRLVRFDCKVKGNDYCFGVIFSPEDIISQIRIWPSYPITLAETIEEFGEPNYVYIGNIDLEELSDRCHIVIMWLGIDISLILDYSITLDECLIWGKTNYFPKDLLVQEIIFNEVDTDPLIQESIDAKIYTPWGGLIEND